MKKISQMFKNKIKPIALSKFSTHIFSQSIMTKNMTKNMINKFPQKMAFPLKIVSRDTKKMRKMFVKTGPTIKHVGTLPTNSIKIRNYMSNEEMEDMTVFCSIVGAIIGALTLAFIAGKYADFVEVLLLTILGGMGGALAGFVWPISIPLLILAIVFLSVPNN